MNLQEIRNFLKDIYQRPLTDGKVRHIVFWYDDKSDFVDDIDDFDIEGVKLLKLTPNNAFKTKYYIEKEDTDSNLLIYSNMVKPEPQNDWLYDIFSHSEEFSTDRATVIMRELKVFNPSLKEVFELYNVFFKNKERFLAFKKLDLKEYTAENIHLGVLAVLTKVKILSFEEVIKEIIKDYLDDKHKLYDDIKKFGNEEVFWELISRYYGYKFEEKSLERLMSLFLITNVDEMVKFELPKEYRIYISENRTNCIVFINHFMNNKADYDYYTKFQNHVLQKLKFQLLLEKKTNEDLVSCDVFQYIDKLIIRRITSLLVEGSEDYSGYLYLLAKRRNTHFYDYYKCEYKSLKWAIQLLQKKQAIGDLIKKESPYNMVTRYVTDYYMIDKVYRKFYYHYDNSKHKEELDDLKILVENSYNNWFLQELAISWYDALMDMNSWRIDGLKQQDDFYDDYIKYNNKDRVFVIISDGLRYETAHELSTRLTNERKGKVELEYMQGVLPSYTKLGMAALLPNHNISVNDKYDVMVDGLSSSGIDNRNKILRSENNNSLAISYDKVIDMKEDEIRKSFAGLEVVYIYHNVIDARGDHASTEKEVFDASELAFKEIMALVNKLVHRVSASKIIITSDHGYLYRRTALEESDKIEGLRLDDGEDNRRFVLTEKDEEADGTLKFSMDYLLGDNSGVNVITPRGNLRFKVQGAGANYVHGGAMLQEIVIPVIKFKNDRSSSTVNNVRKVKISLTSINRKVTNPITFLEFFQEEKIQDKVLVQKIKCYFEDEDGNKISNIKTVVGDSRSENPKDRSYRVEFVLDSRTYDKKKPYYLVIKDEEDDNGVYERIPFTIDIAIIDNFGFR